MSGSMDREPCPWRVVDDAGGAFAFGLVGGSVWNFFGGVRNAPKGHRMFQGWTRARARAPILGGSFAIWGTLFSCCDCTLAYVRRKEDPWNAILAGATTGGILAARAGVKAMGKNALVGGVILACIEGLNIAISRVLMPRFEKQQLEAGIPIDLLDPPQDPLRIMPSKGLVWEKSPTDYNQAHTGFDIDAVSQFDTHQYNWEEEEKKQREQMEAAANASSPKSWYNKLW